MASANAHTKTRRWPVVALVVVAMAALVGVLVLSFAGQAQADGDVDGSTIGLGQAQSSQDGSAMDAATRIGASSEEDSSIPSEVAKATDSAQRSITVKDPDPVIVPVAVDYSNSNAVAKANEVCTLDPLPTAPRISPDVNDGTWSVGFASGYNIESCGGSNITASGKILTNSSVTVAVPESQSYLLGSVVEICYNGNVVIATVTDTGGFAKYGRALDLAPGVYQALGASSADDWGSRTVYYRFL